MIRYEIYANGIPTGMGADDRELAKAMAVDYTSIYGVSTRVVDNEEPL